MNQPEELSGNGSTSGIRNPEMIAGIITVLGGVLIMLGSFLPWLTATAPFAGTISVNGMQGEGIGDGVITLALGAITVLAGIAQASGNLPARWRLLPIVIGVLTGLVAAYAYSDVQGRIDNVTAESDLVTASVGMGIYTLFVGAGFAIVGGLFVRRLAARPPTAMMVLVLLLVGCQGNDAKQQPEAVPAETTASTATTVAPTTTKPPGLGSTQNYREEDPDTGDVYAAKITVFRYRDASILSASGEAELAKKKKRSVGVEARICMTKIPPPPAEQVNISWLPWGLGDNAGEAHPSEIDLVDTMTLEPQYPNFLSTPVGRCRRGWIGFEIPRNWHPEFVEYAAAGVVLSWPIQK